jgi:hypothetical protein
VLLVEHGEGHGLELGRVSARDLGPPANCHLPPAPKLETRVEPPSDSRSQSPIATLGVMQWNRHTHRRLVDLDLVVAELLPRLGLGQTDGTDRWVT